MAQKTPRTGWLESIKGLFSWDPCQFHSWAFTKKVRLKTSPPGSKWMIVVFESPLMVLCFDLRCFDSCGKATLLVRCQFYGV